MTRTLTPALFAVATLAVIATPSYAQRDDRRHGGGGPPQHAVQRGGGHDQAQAQRQPRQPDVRPPVQSQSRGSFRQPPDQPRFNQQPRQSPAQARGNYRQEPQLRSAPQQRSWQPSNGQRAIPRGNSGSYRAYQAPQYQAPRYDAPRYEAPRQNAPRYDAPRYATPRYATPRYDAPRYSAPRYSAPQYSAPQYSAPRSYDRNYGSRGGYYGYQPHGYHSYPLPHGWRPHGYGPRWSLNFYFGRPYGYYGYSAAPYGYYALTPGFVYGAVRIVDAPPDAQVFVDGYYAGIVDDYDGVFQHLNLVPGSHRIDIQAYDYPPVGFDVFVQPGETITYRANFY